MLILTAFQYYNFSYISDDIIEPICFYYAIDFDYFKLVDYIKNKTGLNVNQLIILLSVLIQFSKWKKF